MALNDNEGKCILEPGELMISVGGCQPDKRSEELLKNRNMVQTTTLEVTGNLLELEY